MEDAGRKRAEEAKARGRKAAKKKVKERRGRLRLPLRACMRRLRRSAERHQRAPKKDDRQREICTGQWAV